ncbi:pentapeptide repeat-containing protein [Micromonospora sp. C97]|uniref:pentapeptide repeat-containing protein n=1 Tax=Micromonospora sp. C97 TaxID=2824883 RepID=UPI001B3756D9|nr:pentapeptide repeat-containing protein [Micromonospora sp. C97]MBQ1029169.1 pentapeptide repeat-containing protein [Micromonospora sp. C97]
MPELRLWGIRRSITSAVVAALLLVGALIAAALWYAEWPGLERGATVTAATLFDLLKLVFAVVAGIGGVAALVVAYRRQRVAEHTNALAEFAHQLAHAADLRAEVTKALAEAADERAKIETDRNGVRLFNERFAKASEQLGSEKAAVRLAGVYAMAGLADDWREGRQTCIDVLCAYLRMPYTPSSRASNEAPVQADDRVSTANRDEGRAAREEREVRHTVIRLIGKHVRAAEDVATSWSDYDFDFSGAVLDGGNFSGATFGGTLSFINATFTGGSVSFAGTTFGGGEVSFDGASFSGGEVSFAKATFNGGIASFLRAAFGGATVSFVGASFSGGSVSFDEASFSGGEVSFAKATFNGGSVSFLRAAFGGATVSFVGASFSSGSVSFHGAKFSGGEVSFARAAFEGAEVDFTNASFSGGEVFFTTATFSDGVVSFVAATFGGGEVVFYGARFSGSQVYLVGPKSQFPPKFSEWPHGRPPDGLLLPEQ